MNVRHGILYSVIGLLLTALAHPAAGAGIPLKVAHNPWVGFTQAYLAKDKGIFEKHGLDVEFVNFAGPGDSLPPLIAGHIDISLSCPDNVALLHGTESDAIVSVYQIDTSNGADGVVAKKSIKSIADLKGKKVAATIGQVNQLLMIMCLESGGLKESDVEIVNMNADDAGAAFVAGTLDAAATWEPWLSKAAAADGQVLFTSKDVPGLLGDCVTVTRKTAEERADVVAKFIMAMDEATAYVAAHPDEADAAGAKYMGVKPEEAAEMRAGVKLFTLADNKMLFGTAEKPGPQFDVMKKISDFMVAHDVIQKPADPNAMIYAKFVREAK